MDLVTVFNPTAGEGDRSPDELERWFRSHGHRVDVVTTDAEGWESAWSGRPEEVVVAAGGDGTVQEVALAVADTGVPFTVLPLGTANNIARSLGFVPEDLDATVRSWSADGLAPADLDVPLLVADEGGGRFVEAIGGALVADVAHHGEQQGDGGDSDEKVAAGLRALIDHVETLEPQHWHVEVDDDDVSGDLLAVEVLNIPAIGPQLRLADSDPCDGRLELVLIRPEHRTALMEHAARRLAGATLGAPEVEVHRGTDIVLTAPEGVRLHRDDDHWVAGPSSVLRVTADGSTARVLVPRRR